MLVEYGYTVLAARHGSDALMMAGERRDGIDLLLTDIVMPEMSGRELAETLLDRRPGLKVLYISGYTDDEVLQRGVRGREVALIRNHSRRRSWCGGCGRRSTAAPERRGRRTRHRTRGRYVRRMSGAASPLSHIAVPPMVQESPEGAGVAWPVLMRCWSSRMSRPREFPIHDPHDRPGAVAPATEPPNHKSHEQRSQIYLRIGLDEASRRQLGGPTHVIEGLSPLFMGLVQGGSVAGAAAPGRS